MKFTQVPALDGLHAAPAAGGVPPTTKPDPVMVMVPPPVTGPVVLEMVATDGVLIPMSELLIVMPLPQVPVGGDEQTAWLIFGFWAE